jgi:hypothetical protein
MLDVMCVCCTRGACISRTAEGMDTNLIYSGLQWDRYWEHEKSIPDAQNSVIARALTAHPKYIWMIEEDIEPIPFTLLEMIDTLRKNELDVVCADYKLEGGTYACQYDNKGNLVWGGLGCVLMTADVMRKLANPWFRTNVAYSFDQVTGKIKGPYFDEGDNYGRLDVHFYAQLARHNFKFGATQSHCKHWRIRKYGEPNKNMGCHTLEEL